MLVAYKLRFPTGDSNKSQTKSADLGQSKYIEKFSYRDTEN